MKVSVCIRTFNLEQFVQDAIASALAQRLDAQFEIVIGDDASEDGTVPLLQHFAGLHPDKIRLLIRERNVGPRQNLIETYTACVGEYVAILDGDDYWTSTEKLRLQVEYLDRHTDVAICGHRWIVRRSPSDVRSDSVHGPRRKHIATLTDFVRGYHLTSGTLMIRRSVLPTIPAWLKEVGLEDLILEFLCLNMGHKMTCLPSPMLVYRYHDQAQHSVLSPLRNLEAHVVTWEAILQRIDGSFHRPIHRRLAGAYYRLGGLYAQAGRMAESQAAFNRATALGSALDRMRHQLRRSLPGVYRRLHRARERLSPY
jgi:glycosyltransferase involved in cell wall biosynthesis